MFIFQIFKAPQPQTGQKPTSELVNYFVKKQSPSDADAKNANQLLDGIWKAMPAGGIKDALGPIRKIGLAEDFLKFMQLGNHSLISKAGENKYKLTFESAADYYTVNFSLNADGGIKVNRAYREDVKKGDW